MENSLAILFYIDALDPELIDSEHMPFLSGLIRTGQYFGKTIENVIGYSFAIQSSMFSGKYPDESGYWLPYCHSPSHAPPLFRVLGRIGKLPLVDRTPKIRYLLIRLLRLLFTRKGVQADNIPFSIIGNFLFSPFYYVNEMPCFHELKELILSKYGVLLTYIGPPETKGDDIYDNLAARAGATRSPQMLIVYEDRLDSAAHSYGPSSTAYRNATRYIDKKLENACSKLKSVFKDPIIVFFSDHSQSDLVTHFDVVSYLSRAGFEVGRNYQCFVDATLALFWLKSEATKLRVANLLHMLGTGTLVDDRLRKKYHLCFKNSKLYGDLIYVLKPGRAFFPNFFSPQKPMNGLHGYMPDEEVQKAFIITDERVSVDCQHVKDIRDVILECCRLVH